MNRVIHRSCGEEGFRSIGTRAWATGNARMVGLSDQKSGILHQRPDSKVNRSCEQRERQLQWNDAPVTETSIRADGNSALTGAIRFA
jgi:hypothetical protein